MSVDKVTLNNGVEMPEEGFGVFQIHGFGPASTAVREALDVGYRSIDTAQVYQNEEAVGQAIQESNVDRHAIFLTTKVWITNYGYENTKKSVLGSLRRLKTNYLDLVILHQPFGDYYGAYRALEDLYREGVIRAIGVSNFNAIQYIDLANFAQITPMVDQVQTHVFNQQKELQNYAKKYGTYVEAWAPFAEGRNGLFNNDDLKEIGEEYGKSAAQVALRYLIQKNIIVIPKSTHKDRMEENLNVWDFELNDVEMKAISDMDQKKSLFLDHSDPKSIENFIEMVKNS